jgi:hypothetical protein
MADRDLLHHAATCYRRAGHLDDAARCFRGARLYREAAAVWESLGALAEAATDLAAAGRPEHAAWLVAHRLGDPTRARELLAHPPPAPSPAGGVGEDQEAAAAASRVRTLLRDLTLARCEVADTGGNEPVPPSVIAVLDAVMDELDQPDRGGLDHDLEDRAVELAETIQRPDLAALVFAAALRGARPGVAQRWDAWSQRTFGVALVLPDTTRAGDR